MALDTNALAARLADIFGNKGNTERDAAEQMAAAIADFLATAEVTALPSEIQVQGSPSAQANAVPLRLTGGIT